MGIKQLNATYVAVEDRIVLRVSTEAREEFRFWLTRPVTAELMAGLHAATTRPLTQRFEPQIAQSVAAFEQEAVHAQTRLDDKFVPGETLPLGEAPKLVAKVSVSEQADDIMLQLVTAKGPSVSLRLTRDLAHQVRVLVDKVQKGAKWALPHPGARPAAAHSSGESVPITTSPQNKTLH